MIVLIAIASGMLLGGGVRYFEPSLFRVGNSVRSIPNITTLVVHHNNGMISNRGPLCLGVGACGVVLGYMLGLRSSSSGSGPAESPETAESAVTMNSDLGENDSPDPIEVPSSQEGGGGGPPPILQVPTVYPDQHLYQQVVCTQASWANRSGKYRTAAVCAGLKSAKTPITSTTVMMARGQSRSCCQLCCPGW